MAHDPDLDPFLDALAATARAVEDLSARVAALEAAPPAPQEPEPETEPEPEPPVPEPEPEPQPTGDLNRQLIGLAIPDGEMLTNTSAKMQRIRDLGITAVRMDVRWERVQSSGWGYYDGIIRTLRGAGIHVLAILGGSAKVTTQAEAEAFARHAGEAVAWLAARDVHHVQWWNEPNHASRITTPENYSRAINLAYPAAKAANPRVFVVGAGLSAINNSVNGHISTVDWLTRCYVAGAKGCYDALAVHPYSYPYNLDQSTDWTGWGNMVRRMRPVMERNGEAGLKIWATETGFPTNGGSGRTEANQRDLYAARLVAEMGKLDWLGPVFHYGLDDRGGSTADAENWFGLYRPDGTPKPAAATIRQAVAALA